ncbi:MAG: TIGR02757 family protein [Bdellovibrionaceae bacterium]|nr:TIGR02757 family protein [Pseudobdellovibrionaceae bacterium]|tara:strand:+ start:1961 stop:2854 length:894 start_codon:yes stop_codon:yes gene_type:complete
MASQLKYYLDQNYKRFHRPELLDSDPLFFVHQYSNPFDQEAVALFSALLSYGNVKQIKKSVSLLLNVFEDFGGPHRAIFQFASKKGQKTFLNEMTHWKHRLNDPRDLIALIVLYADVLERYQSLGDYLVSIHRSSLLESWHFWVTDWKKKGKKIGGPYFSHLLSSPLDGSACKRLCMLFRWMVRKDKIDVGLWQTGSPLLTQQGFSPNQLFLPLDTHVGSLCQLLGLTQKKTLNWKMTEEVTEAFRVLTPKDPVRYDFSLCRLGILDLCQKRWNVEICEQCQLQPVCLFREVEKKSF